MKLNLGELLEKIDVNGTRDALFDVFTNGISQLVTVADADVRSDGMARALSNFTFEAWRTGNTAVLEECKADIPVLMEDYRLAAAGIRKEGLENLVNIVYNSLGVVATVLTDGLSGVLIELAKNLAPAVSAPTPAPRG